jgi:glycosyltransferase involved in cell wall biosynthesis
MTEEPIQQRLALSMVIPLYRSEACIPSLLARLEQLIILEPWEVIFVDDGSPDRSYAILLEQLHHSTLPAVVAQHTRNFGEHQAVLSGYRLARGRHVVNLDDDLQNPPEEALRLWQHACSGGHDVVYGNYQQKQHTSWRNLGSKFANRTAHLLLDLPGSFYLSSFRCVHGSIAKAAAAYRGPFPYIDGLISQLTQSIVSLDVRHDSRYTGSSGYDLHRLIRLWLNILTSFSLMPLRLATLLGLCMAGTGIILIAIIVADTLLHGVAVAGWASLLSTILFFGGVQCLLLGIAGEYLGRVLLTVGGKPQSCLRSIERLRR